MKALQPRSALSEGEAGFLMKPCSAQSRRGRARKSLRTSASEPQAQSTASTSSVCVDIPIRMNTIPHPREMRRYFYNDTAQAILEGLNGKETRMRARLTIPELNPEFDVYRVGTLLELVREIASQVAQDGRRVKVCVQASMGQGVFQALPLSLNGVSRIMRAMDWGDIVDFVSFGAVSAEDVDESDVYILICPQNMVAGNILTNLSDMISAVEKAGKAMVLINPILKDVPSANGVMGVRGRAERLQFDASFKSVYHFRLLYFSASMYPIMGALRFSYGGKWQVYKRCQLSASKEEYQLWGEFDSEPSGGEMTDCLNEKIPYQLRGLDNTKKKEEDRPWWW